MLSVVEVRVQDTDFEEQGGVAPFLALNNLLCICSPA
jgi:hypothetical protein